MNNDLNKAFQLVSQSSTIKQGQSQIAYLRKNLTYPMDLLMYMSNNQNLQGQLRAAIQLKIWCQTYNNLEIFQRDAYQQIIQDVKEKIILAYLSFDKKISETLRPAIVKLTNAEFPRIDKLRISTLEFGLNPVKITLKYTYLGRSDPLYQQIILVCDQAHDFLLTLTLQIINSPLDPSILLILQSLMNIFYHLNYQDLHPKFEDNLNNWMSILKTVMNYQNTNEEVFKCKGAALESILLYASKYKEDVEQSIKGFSSEIWNLCSNATEDMEYDSIVFNCLKYFKSIILWAEMKQFFVDNLGELIQKLIIPNLKIDKSKIQMFFEQPDLFFQYYFKNNQMQTRRAASLDLLRVICRNFPNFQGYCLNMLQNYSQSSSVAQKCNLLNFLIDSSSKSFREIDGCTETFLSPSLLTQCYDHIVKPDLGQIYEWLITNENKLIQDEIGMTLLVTLMRFVYFFRIYISTDNYQLIIKLVAKINTASNSIRTMVFMVINAYVTVRHGDFMHFRNLKYYWNAENTHAIATDILLTIYKNDQQYPMLNQNLTRMLYTLSKTLGASSVQYYDYFDQLFKQMLGRTLQFDFKSVSLLFESIGILACWTAKSGGSPKQRLQAQIFQYLQLAIKRNSDLLNFCFQILAIFLQFQSEQSNQHQQIYISILDPSNWIQQNISVMSSYIQYISSYLSRSTNSIINDKDKFQGILMKLVQLEHFDLFFRFLESIIKITNIDAFYEMGYFQLAVHGTENIVQRSIAGKKQGLLFIFKLMSIYDIRKVLNYIAAVSPNMFQSILNDSRQIIRTIQFRKDRKFMYAALTQVISMGILQTEMQGNLLSLLVDNSTNRFVTSALQNPYNIVEKKQSTYQKLQIFSQLQPKQNAFEVDQQQQLCRTYIVCQKSQRPSLQYLNAKNHERMNRLLEKHGKNIKLN